MADFIQESDSISYEEVSRKRAMLASARLQFSPESQEIREQAIDYCVEHTLFGLDSDKGVRCTDLQDVLTGQFGPASTFVRQGELRRCLDRLVDVGSVDVLSDGRCRLTTSRRDVIKTAENAANNRLNTVASTLFATTGPRFAEYKACFYEVLCVIFADLGEQYVRILTNRAERSSVSKSPILRAALRLARLKHTSLDQSLLSAGISRFFESTNPDFDALKWNLAQNYYIAKCLGLDAAGQLLSRGLFGDSTLVLDTNIILQAGYDGTERRRSFDSLTHLCRMLGISLEVCQISIDEARSVLAAARQAIPKVKPFIPASLAGRVKNVFFQQFRDSEPNDVGAFFETYEEFLNGIRQSGIEVVDDRWFTNSAETTKLASLRERIKEASRTRKGHPKGDAAALHDAQLLTWAAQEAQMSRQVWVVTADKSLVALRTETLGAANVISFDALLQWLAPIAFDSSTDFARVFAESIKYQVLPAENFFALEDFVVFAEMEWDCTVLPPQEVEECIRAIRASAGNLDPRLARDREKLAGRVRKFFADPLRKFNEERQEYETTIIQFERQRDETAKHHQDEVVTFRATLEDTKEQVAELRETVSVLERRLRSSEEIASQIGGERNRLQVDLQIFRRRAGAFAFLCGLASIAWATNSFGEGANLWQRLGSSWEISGELTLILTYACAKIAGTQSFGWLGLNVSEVFSKASREEPQRETIDVVPAIAAALPAPQPRSVDEAQLRRAANDS